MKPRSLRPYWERSEKNQLKTWARYPSSMRNHRNSAMTLQRTPELFSKWQSLWCCTSEIHHRNSKFHGWAGQNLDGICNTLFGPKMTWIFQCDHSEHDNCQSIETRSCLLLKFDDYSLSHEIKPLLDEVYKSIEGRDSTWKTQLCRQNHGMIANTTLSLSYTNSSHRSTRSSLDGTEKTRCTSAKHAVRSTNLSLQSSLEARSSLDSASKNRASGAIPWIMFSAVEATMVYKRLKWTLSSSPSHGGEVVFIPIIDGFGLSLYLPSTALD